MLKMIEQQEYACYRGRVDLFLELIQLQQGLSLAPEERRRSTFIVDQGEEGTIYGGAIIQHQHISQVHRPIANVISTILPHQYHVWTAAFFLSDEADKKEGHSFYKDLLKELTAFGEKQKSGFLCLSLSSDEYFRTKKKEGWPYVLEISPDETPNGLFYGILSLRGSSRKNHS